MKMRELKYPMVLETTGKMLKFQRRFGKFYWANICSLWKSLSNTVELGGIMPCIFQSITGHLQCPEHWQLWARAILDIQADAELLTVIS